VDDLDIDRARNLLGPAGAAPLRAAAVAEAWFGRPVDREATERLARVLEAVGLVRRDDHRRDRLWVLGVTDTSLFPDEAKLEEQLKQSNPKGRLLELCMRLRIEPPVVDLQQEGAFYTATMTLPYSGQTLNSDPVRAASKKTAEQLAAHSLLDAISKIVDTEDLVRVADDEASHLQSSNPKGRLLEWCAKSKIPPPRFEQEASPDGYRIRALLLLPSQDEIASGWYVAAKMKNAEQAAAASILQRLPDQQSTSTAPTADDATTPPPSRTSDAAAVANAASRLNELTQAGVLQNTGYEHVGQAGPSHQPTFTVVAWAKTHDGRTLRTDPAQAPSKKTAQRAAAGYLLNLLVDEGITSSGDERTTER
jgi:dsRNA-specific ribonuclease